MVPQGGDVWTQQNLHPNDLNPLLEVKKRRLGIKTLKIVRGGAPYCERWYIRFEGVELSTTWPSKNHQKSPQTPATRNREFASSQGFSNANQL